MTKYLAKYVDTITGNVCPLELQTKAVLGDHPEQS